MCTSRAGSVCSMELFPVLSRASSRNMERDWENGSIASSITSIEYSGEQQKIKKQNTYNMSLIIYCHIFCLLKVQNSSRSQAQNQTSQSLSMPSPTAAWLERLMRSRRMLFLRSV